MARKQVNDAAAYIRGLAQLRGRNAEWAERAVREAVSLAAHEAAAQKVIDLQARDLPDLLRQLDGRSLRVGERVLTLATGGATVERQAPDWRARLLAVLTDPSVALILMMIGIYGLIFELANPGMALPGVLGGICLLLGLYALQMLPVNYAGLALIALGLAFMVGEAFVASFGVLGIGGIVSFVVGALILIDTEVPGYGIPPGLVVALALLSAALIVGLLGMALRTRRQAVVVAPPDWSAAWRRWRRWIPNNPAQAGCCSRASAGGCSPRGRWRWASRSGCWRAGPAPGSRAGR